MCDVVLLPFAVTSILRILLSVFSVPNIYQQYVIRLTLGGCIFSWFLLLLFCLPTMYRTCSISNPLISQQAGAIPMPTGSHSTEVLCSGTFSGRRQPETLVYILTIVQAVPGPVRSGYHDVWLFGEECLYHRPLSVGLRPSG